MLNGAAPNGSSSVDITKLSLLFTFDIPVKKYKHDFTMKRRKKRKKEK